ncbi:MAG: AEC family transporter [Candidatus Gracilibacteria bacterium]|nr:AEC family transporter [Candidatus Gracilibacteria bacterium]
MEVFLTLFSHLIPLYLLIMLGYISGRILKIPKEPIATLLIYVITPVVVFYGVINTQLDVSILSLPILFYLICCALCLTFYAIGRRIWNDPTKNILAMAAGTGNTGYFGLPVALMLFGEDVLGIAVFALLGFIVYESTMGFYITARGNFTGAESLRKVFRLPSIYAFVLGIVVNLAQVDLGGSVMDVLNKFTGAYTVLGMMMIGLGLANIKRAAFDTLFIGLTFLAKFFIWPLVIFSIIFLDQRFLDLFSDSIHRIMLLMSIVPLAANTVTLATELKAHPEKAAVAVLPSSLFALFFIPFMTVLFLQ